MMKGHCFFVIDFLHSFDQRFICSNDKPEKEAEDEFDTERRKSSDKTTFLHRPIFDNHRRRTTVIMDNDTYPTIDEVISQKTLLLPFRKLLKIGKFF